MGTAAPGQVLSGKTFTNSSTVGATGTMPNKGAWKNTPSNKGKVTIPEGYHNGSGYIDTTSVYNQGFLDGQQNTTQNLNITYTYHKHTGSSGSTANGCYTLQVQHVHSDNCYTSCTGVWVYEGRRPNNNGVTQDSYSCSINGAHGPGCMGSPYLNGNGAGTACGFRVLNCLLGGTVTYELGCGKDTNTIESATIKY